MKVKKLLAYSKYTCTKNSQFVVFLKKNRKILLSTVINYTVSNSDIILRK